MTKGRKPESKKARNLAPPVKTDRNGFVRCRVCGCTEIEPCCPPCSWADQDLCTTCDDAAKALVDWQMNAHRGNWAALRREANRQFGNTPIPYVLTNRGCKRKVVGA